MRAIFLEGNYQDEVIVEGDRFHHLINVVRAKIGDEILLLNGRGTSSLATIVSINKKVAHLIINKQTNVQRSSNITVALCLPKRDALDLCIKQAVEIGINKTILIESDFSVNKSVKHERVERLIESAIEQSNNPFKMQIESISSLDKIELDDFDQVFCLSSQDQTTKDISYDQHSNLLLIIGPEGGFSDQERQYLNNNKKINTIYLNTFILRTPTALSVGSGHILSRCSKN